MFQFHKATNSTKGHLVYVYKRRKNKYRFLIFTHSESTNGKKNIELIHNIDPDEQDKKSFVRPQFFIDDRKNFDPPRKTYRIHKDDQSKIRSLKK